METYSENLPGPPNEKDRWADWQARYSKLRARWIKMSGNIINRPFSHLPSIGGLWVFWGIQVVCQYALWATRRTDDSLQMRAENALHLSIAPNLPTGSPLGNVGKARKAALSPQGATPLGVLRRCWPYIRGRDGPG